MAGTGRATKAVVRSATFQLAACHGRKRIAPHGVISRGGIPQNGCELARQKRISEVVAMDILWTNRVNKI
jgi:hypothetical protein